MTPWRALARAFSQRLYLRIWLAVVGGVALLTLLVGWAWRIAAEQNNAPLAPPARDIVLRSSSGAACRKTSQVSTLRQPKGPGPKPTIVMLPMNYRLNK